MRDKRYWGYRIDNDARPYFWDELLAGRLRQGWGWLQGQDLRNLTVDEGAGRNRPMFVNVKKGDILLVPRLRTWDEVAIVEATEDWDVGYKFEIDKEKHDYGHIFPAKRLRNFTRNNKYVSGNIRSTLCNLGRFWNIDHYADDVEKLLKLEDSELSETQDYESRLECSIKTVFNEMFSESDFADKIYMKLNEQFNRTEWEYALVHGLKLMFPNYHVERVGGPKEKEHGTDILVKLPGIIIDSEYAIAIQVKDYEGFVAADVIEQINMAENYWEKDNDNVKVIEKIVIITKADKDINHHLTDKHSGVRFIFASDFKELLSVIGQTFIGVKSHLDNG